MALLLQIDENTKIPIEPSIRAEGEVAGVGKDMVLKIEEVIDQTKKIANKIREGLEGLQPSEVKLELGFSGGHNLIVLSSQGSIKIGVKWNTK
jgi:hypothetical protein